MGKRHNPGCLCCKTHVHRGSSSSSSLKGPDHGSLCAIAYSIAGQSAWSAGAGRPYNPATDGYPSFYLAGRTVTISRQVTVGGVTSFVGYAHGKTNARGHFCITIPPADRGTFKVHVDVVDCPAQERTVAAGAPGTYVDVCFGFCCWRSMVNASGDLFDWSGTAASGYGPGQATEIVAISSDTCPGGTPARSPTVEDCVTIQKAGHWDRCACLVGTCDVPHHDNALTITSSPLIYPKTDWIRDPSGQCCTRTRGRPPEILPRTLYATFNGPHRVFGDYSGQTIALHLVAADSDDGEVCGTDCRYNGRPCQLHWSSGCLPGAGQGGLCFTGPTYSCCQDTTDPDTGYVYTNCSAARYSVASYPTYASCKADLYFRYGDNPNLGTSGPVDVSFQNFWNADCPAAPDQAPVCPSSSRYSTALASPYALAPCGCGSGYYVRTSGTPLTNPLEQESGSTYLAEFPGFSLSGSFSGPLDIYGSSTMPDSVTDCLSHPVGYPIEIPITVHITE